MFKFCSLDLESTTYDEITGENKDKIDIIGFYFDNTYYCFKTIEEFWDFIDVNIIKLHKYYCLAHNGGGYDFLFLVRIPNKYKENFKINVVINGKLVDLSYEKKIGSKKYVLTFRDSYKVLSASLKKLGKAFGFPKTEMPSWRVNQKRGISFEEHYNQSVIYNKNDCKILIDIANAFFNETIFSFLKEPPLTVSSLALKTFKKMNNLKSLLDLSNASKYDWYARKAYSGGRTEVFKTYVDEDYSYVDVNSLYPSVMLDEVPVGKATLVRDRIGALECYKNKLAGVYEVEWEAPDIHTPILWERREHNYSHKLIFGLNNKMYKKGKGHYALPELELAEENGYRIMPLSCLVTLETAKVFNSYVNHFIKMKYEGGAKKTVAKLLLNSLYGKTGQRLTVQTTGSLNSEEAFKRSQKFKHNLNTYLNAINDNASPELLDKLLNDVKDTKFELIDKELNVYNYMTKRHHRDTNVMWASYITARARVELWKVCELCDFEQAYVDTDSCMMPMEFKKKVPIDDKELGKWKEEGVVHHGRFYAPKSYILDITAKNVRQTKVVMKGIPTEMLRKYYVVADNEEDIIIPHTKYKDMVNIFKPDAEFETTKVTPYKQALRMKVESGIARHITKKLSLDYDKRIVLDNGCTIPY